MQISECRHCTRPLLHTLPRWVDGEEPVTVRLDTGWVFVWRDGHWTAFCPDHRSEARSYSTQEVPF